MYAMKTDAERGVIGAWARNARLAAGYTSAERAVDAAQEAGIHLSLVYLRGIEAGAHRPGRELLDALGRLYRSDPPRQGGVSEDWLAAVRRAVAEGVEEGVRRAVERLADGGAPPRLPAPPRPGSPRTQRASVTPIRGGVEIDVE